MTNMQQKVYAPYIYRTLQGETAEVKRLVKASADGRNDDGAVARLLLLVRDFDMRISDRLTSRFSDAYRENYYDWGDYVLCTKRWWNTYSIVRLRGWNGWDKSTDVALSLATGNIAAIGTKEEILRYVNWLDLVQRSEDPSWVFHEKQLFDDAVLPRCAEWKFPRCDSWKQNVLRAMRPMKQICVVCGGAFGGLECADGHMHTHVKVIEGTYVVEYEEVG